ncbi:DUF2070 family protein [Candidatus Micrarchaeota archaeon]|nr:DUF2070 family protein [Candidatus Micrarchaeota archaeon]
MEIDRMVSARRRWLRPAPGYKSLVLYLFAFSFLAGVAMQLPRSEFSQALLYGGTEGIALLALPAILAGVAVASLVAGREFKARLKHFLLTALACVLVVSLAYVGIAALGKGYSPTAQIFILLIANALCLLVWFVSLTLFSGRSRPAALSLSFVHPVANLAFMVLFRRLSLIETTVPQTGFWILIPKFLIASLILLVALWVISFLINAPAKRNFGVSAVQAAGLFAGQWLYGSKKVEAVLDDLGEEVTTTIGAMAFRRKVGNTLKAVFLAPNVHFGPFGNVGGSEFPAIVSKEVGQKLGCEALMFHGTVYHDFNPVSSSSASELGKAFIQCVNEGKKKFSTTASFAHQHSGDADAHAIVSGNDAFISLSPAPYPSGDIDYASGIALTLAAQKKFETAVVFDRHNANGPVPRWEAGSGRFYEFLDAVQDLQPEKPGKLRVGIASDPLWQFSTKQGLGRHGLKVAVLETSSKNKSSKPQRACIAVFDANNTLPEFRKACLERLRKFHFAFCDIFTTDTHCVNELGSVNNALGANVNWEPLLEALERCAREAVGDLEECDSKICSRKFSLRVLGAGRASEVVSTINAIIAVTRIAAPLILIAAVALAFLVLLAT